MKTNNYKKNNLVERINLTKDEFTKVEKDLLLHELTEIWFCASFLFW